MTTVTASANKAYRESIEDSPSVLATELQEVFGQKLAAHMLSVRVQTFSEWASGARRPRGKNEEALRHLSHIYKVLAPTDDVHTIRAWFVGYNQMLNDTAPAEVASSGRYRDVLTAARAYMQLS